VVLKTNRKASTRKPKVISLTALLWTGARVYRVVLSVPTAPRATPKLIAVIPEGTGGGVQVVCVQPADAAIWGPLVPYTQFPMAVR
jgi:hypothetical protein